ncbi:MAG: alpha/beta hydrolase [Clostridia bacterium]|nr:alpha/beta hydrolase [Clostridia bacterium]
MVVFLFLILILTILIIISVGIVSFNIVFARMPLKIGFSVVKEIIPSQLDSLRNDINKSIDNLKKIHSEQWEIDSYDGIKLVATFIPVKNAKRTVLCAHGYRSSGYFDFSLAVGYFLDTKCNLLIIDQRAHGRSEGKYITFGIKERFDIRDWTHEICKRLGNDLPIYLDGVSMGCATVLLASALELPPCVKGIIADCGYTSCHDIVYKFCKNDIRIHPTLIMPSLNLIFKLNVGCYMNSVKVYEEVKKAKVPIIFAHGDADDFVPIEMTIKNYKACSSTKKLIISEGAEHGMSYVKSTEMYKKCIKELFEQ